MKGQIIGFPVQKEHWVRRTDKKEEREDAAGERPPTAWEVIRALHKKNNCLGGSFIK